MTFRNKKRVCQDQSLPSRHFASSKYADSLFYLNRRHFNSDYIYKYYDLLSYTSFFLFISLLFGQVYVLYLKCFLNSDIIGYIICLIDNGKLKNKMVDNCFQTMVLEKSFDSSLDCKEIKPVNL